MKKIKENFSEKLHIKPATCVVKKYIRPVYACKSCEEIRQTKMPYHLIKRCSVTSETLVHIAIAKYLDGMPLNRQEKGLKRHGVEISRDQMARWMVKIGDKARLICGTLHKKLISGDYIAMDETYLQVLNEKGRRADQKSFLIGQAREGPPGKSIILFHYEPSRSSKIMANYLRGFKGSLLSDGLAVYQSYSQMAQISHGGCWSHARRSFADAFKAKKIKQG